MQTSHESMCSSALSARDGETEARSHAKSRGVSISAARIWQCLQSRTFGAMGYRDGGRNRGHVLYANAREQLHDGAELQCVKSFESAMKEELARRKSNVEKLREFFLSKPLVWIGVHELARIAGFAAWRTRCSDCRQVIETAGLGTIRWNGNCRESAYRYEPFQSLGRSAETRVESPQRALF